MVAFFFKSRSIYINPSEMLRILNQIQICSDASEKKSDLVTHVCAAGAGVVCLLLQEGMVWALCADENKMTTPTTTR